MADPTLLPLKRCTRCGETKPRVRFSRDSSSRDGLRYSCKDCAAAYHARRVRDHGAKISERNRRWYAENRDQQRANIKRWSEANRERINEGERRRYAERREEMAEKKRLWREANPDLARAIKARYRASNPDGDRRWKQKNGDKLAQYHRARRKMAEPRIPAAEYTAWERAQAKVCFYCDSPCADNYHVDHWVPLKRGGWHHVANFVIACPACNLRKHAKDPISFMVEIGRALAHA